MTNGWEAIDLSSPVNPITLTRSLCAVITNWWLGFDVQNRVIIHPPDMYFSNTLWLLKISVAGHWRFRMDEIHNYWVVLTWQVMSSHNLKLGQLPEDNTIFFQIAFETFTWSSSPVIHKVGNVGIFKLLKFENKFDREISRFKLSLNHGKFKFALKLT